VRDGTAVVGRIIGYTAQSVMNHIDFGLDPQLSLAIPHFMNLDGSTAIEPPVPGLTVDYDAAALEAALEARGHTVTVISQESGLSVVQVTPDGLIGGADLRRDGPTVQDPRPASIRCHMAARSPGRQCR
jgi:gamma-glutamyltranspeptidase/glutathione hydrolase